MAAGNTLSRMFAIDHLELAVAWTPVGEVSCTSLPNSTGRAAALTAYGSADAAANDLRLRAVDLPAHAFGLLISGRVDDARRCWRASSAWSPSASDATWTA